MKKTFASLGVAAAASLWLTGCGTWAPGLYMPGSNPDAQGGPYSEDVVRSLAIYPITGPLIEQMKPAKPASALPPAEPWVYRLGPQDVLRITVLGHRELSAGVTIDTTQGQEQLVRQIPGRVVDENGFVYVPLAGSIKAGGLTLNEFRTNLRKALSEYIKNPQVEVDVAAFRSQWVLMSGQVSLKGKLPVTDVPMRLSDALALAGGVGADAALEEVVLVRGGQTYVMDMYRIIYEGDQTHNVLARHGDLMTVPDRKARKVFVAGEVGGVDTGLARSIVMRLGKMSLTEVIMDAGGPNMMTSKLNQVYVMRDRGDGIPVIYQIDAKSPTAFVLADKFMLEPRDLVYVNPTNIAQVGRTIAQFFPAISGVNQVGGANNQFK